MHYRLYPLNSRTLLRPRWRIISSYMKRKRRKSLNSMVWSESIHFSFLSNFGIIIQMKKFFNIFETLFYICAQQIFRLRSLWYPLINNTPMEGFKLGKGKKNDGPFFSCPHNLLMCS